ncbi:FAD:protein FMN transferase [Bythopirellula polymerisocia]|uniref:FAD:protein FMN transferase n=1 Tax=Bythopirellula polymerisocia TaxID=2528003 RepID=A0A5C6CVW3_9BACT|nr:FAD:protein FMN transferase [Bythopirellula polymerisocia]TWU28578.1 Thiamine biosynthesis lipoprotein ApbE precursor [Bythopirellula polymerisocia]
MVTLSTALQNRCLCPFEGPTGYNGRMADRQHHSRRDFLQGKAAAETLVNRAQEWAQGWLDSMVGPLVDRMPSDPAMHVRASRRAMACEFAVQYHQADRKVANAFMDAFDLIEAVEDQLTIYRPESTVIDINKQAANGPVEVDPDLLGLLEQCMCLFQETNGAFDITSTPLSRVWGFLKRTGQIPNEEELAEALSHVDTSKIELSGQEKTIQFLQPGIEINFNSIGKGYALDRVAQFLDEQGASDYLWHGGSSSILARGCNRASLDEYWTIGLRHPLEPHRHIAEFHLRNRSLGTAGGATQYFEAAGKKFGHILDPRTGWPAEGIFTATVLAPTAAEADALATAFYVSGVEGAAEYCANHAEVGAVLVCPKENQSDISIHAFNLPPEDWTPSTIGKT